MASSLQSRGLRITFTLASGSFNRAGQPDKVVFEGLRARVDITANGGDENMQARAEIYGVSQEAMNRLTLVNYMNTDFLRNVLLIEASNGYGGYAPVFEGEIFQALADYAGAPEVVFAVDATSGLVGSLQHSLSKSYPGTQKVSDVMRDIAVELGATLEDSGVTATITDMYLSGSPISRARKIANATSTQVWYLQAQNILAISPAGKSREVPKTIVSPATGLVGWPSKTHVGVDFTRQFDPYLVHGTPITLQTSVTPCAGDWYVISMVHRLESELPGGAWFSFVTATGGQYAIRR